MSGFSSDLEFILETGVVADTAAFHAVGRAKLPIDPYRVGGDIRPSAFVFVRFANE